jgi:hypothetical protein
VEGLGFQRECLEDAAGCLPSLDRERGRGVDINLKLCLAARVGRGEADGARQVQRTAFIARH